MPPGQRGWELLLVLQQAEPAEQRPRLNVRGLARDAPDVLAEDDVVEHGPPGEEQVTLEHVPDMSCLTGHVAVAEHHAAAIGLTESGQDVEQRALAAAARTHEADELAGTDVEAHIIDGGHGTVLEGLGDRLGAKVARTGRWDRSGGTVRAGVGAVRPGCHRGHPRPCLSDESARDVRRLAAPVSRRRSPPVGHARPAWIMPGGPRRGCRSARSRRP